MGEFFPAMEAECRVGRMYSLNAYSAPAMAFTYDLRTL